MSKKIKTRKPHKYPTEKEEKMLVTILVELSQDSKDEFVYIKKIAERYSEKVSHKESSRRIGWMLDQLNFKGRKVGKGNRVKVRIDKQLLKEYTG